MIIASTRLNKSEIQRDWFGKVKNCKVQLPTKLFITSRTLVTLHVQRQVLMFCIFEEEEVRLMVAKNVKICVKMKIYCISLEFYNLHFACNRPSITSSCPNSRQTWFFIVSQKLFFREIQQSSFEIADIKF